MTDETSIPEASEMAGGIDSDRSMDIVQETLETFLEIATVDAVYGEPIESGEHLIIPSAEVVAIMGFGTGSGYGGNTDEEGKVNEGGGNGGGGGGKVLSRPVAIIVASPEGVRVEPVVDVTKVALAVFTTAGFMAAMLARMLRPARH